MSTPEHELTRSEEIFSRSVRRGISDARVSQSAMAGYLGVAPGQFSQRMNGLVKWTLRDMHNISTALGVSLLDMLNEDDTSWLNRIEPGAVKARLDAAARSKIRDTVQ
ncbi:hypothetical protein ACIRLA_46635, partial [Streptomyces sp. NPDC102364]|uniref:hypothetical protein n=1 Tax=Streptomyces sp. NPDC102364 TaxID=3366161 RepID=UPI0038299F1A